MSDFFIGQVMMTGFNFAPKFWAQCNGQLLPISQNQALFSLLGTQFGGNGTTNFALPDLPTLPVHIHTKPLALRGLQGQVALHGGIELPPLRFAEDGIRHLLDIVGGQLLLPHGHKHALPLERGWCTRHDE